MKWVIFIFVLAIWIEFSQAGKEVHGGAAVICRSDSDEILSSETLDLWVANLPKEYRGFELEIDSKTPKNPNQKEEETQTEQKGFTLRALSRLKAVNPFFYQRVNQNLNYLNRITTWVGKEIRFDIPDDTGNYFLPAGCESEWAAIFLDEDWNGDEGLFIPKEIWNHMHPINRASLMVHEAVYYTERELTQASISARSRQVVAALFSDLTFESLNSGVPEKAEICLLESEKQKFTLYWRFYKGNLVRRQFSMVNGHYVLTRKYFDVPFGGWHDSGKYETRTQSVFEGNEKIIVLWNLEEKYLSFQLGPYTSYGKFQIEISETQDFLLNSCGSIYRNDKVYNRAIKILTLGSDKEI